MVLVNNEFVIDKRVEVAFAIISHMHGNGTGSIEASLVMIPKVPGGPEPKSAPVPRTVGTFSLFAANFSIRFIREKDEICCT